MGKLTADPNRPLPLGLTEMLADPRCPIRGFFDEVVHPAGLKALSVDYKRQVGVVDHLIENPAARTRRLAALAGTLAGLRLQLGFSTVPYSSGVVVGLDVAKGLNGLQRLRLDDRGVPMYLGDQEETEFLEAFRPGLGTLTQEETAAVVLDVRLQIQGAATSPLASLRADTSSETCATEVTFVASEEEKVAAFADLVVDGRLIEVKGDRRPGQFNKRYVQQLISYLIFDTNDVWGITTIGLYFTRIAKLVTWTTDELLALLGTEHDLAELRTLTRRHLHDTRYW